MSRRKGGIGLTLESHDDSSGDKTKEAVDFSNTAEAKELDSKASGEKIEKLHDDVDTATESLESIYSLVDSLEAFQQTGGLEQNGAGVLKRFADDIMYRNGLDDHRVVTSLEAFGATSRKTEATKLSMEGLSEMAKDLWAKIIEALKKIKAFFLKQFYHYFGQAETLLKRAKALAEAGRKGGGTKENQTITDKGLLNAIKVDGKAPTLSNVSEFATFAENAIAKMLTSTAVEKIAEGKAEVDVEAVGSQVKGVAEFSPVEGDAGLHLSDEDVAMRTHRLPGDKALYLIVPKSPEGGKAKFVSRIDLKLAPFDKKAGQESASDSLPVLSTTDAGRIGGTLENLLAEIVATRSKVTKLGADQDKLIAEAEKESKDVKDEDDTPEKRAELRAAQAMFANARNLSIRPLAEIIDYALATSRRLLEYGEKSLSQYKKAA